MVTNYTRIGSFSILGSPATAKNSRVVTGKGSFAGKQASYYSRLFGIQIEKQKQFLDGVPYLSLIHI